MKKTLLKCAGMALAACLVLTTVFAGSNKNVQPLSDTEEGNTMNALDFVREMKIGWNLGNTFDAPSETAWGNPATSHELLQLVKDLGFETIRIPISWSHHVGAAPEYKIDEAFMERVDTVVQDALDIGLFVIINSHHDNEIYSPQPQNQERGCEYLTAVWTQIGEHFQDADYRLVFQTMNEPRVVGTAYEWNINFNNPDCVAALEVVNQLNQAALDAIRATGGKNADRFVIISPYCGSPDSVTSSKFVMPQDSAEGKLILSIHAYRPYNLALNLHSTEASFNKSAASEIRSFMKGVNYRYVKNGIPVIIDEMGCLNKDNPEARYEWGKSYVSSAVEFGMTCVWWDNGQIAGTGENFGLIDRRKLEVYPASQLAYQGLMDGLTVGE